MKRSTPAPAFALVAALALGVSPANAQFEGGVEGGWATAKYRLRKGAPERTGSSIFARDLGTQEETLRPGAWVAGGSERDRLRLKGWWLEASGSGRFEEDEQFAGQTVPAGLAFDSEARFLYLQLAWLHRFEAGANLFLLAGLSAEYMRFTTDMDIGDLRLEGLYPMLQTLLVWRFAPAWEAEALLAGYNIGFANGDTTIIQPHEIRGMLRHRGERWTAGLGYDLYHVHLERNANTPEEDVIHMRHRAYVADITWSF